MENGVFNDQAIFDEENIVIYDLQFNEEKNYIPALNITYLPHSKKIIHLELTNAKTHYIKLFPIITEAQNSANIQAHSKYSYHYINAAFKANDIRDWFLNMVGFCKIRPPLFGETREDYYKRKVYGSSLDCFHRPIIGPAASTIRVCLRKEKIVGNTRQLVVDPGKYQDAINFGSYNYLGFGGFHETITPIIIETLQKSGACVNGFSREIGVSEE